LSDGRLTATNTPGELDVPPEYRDAEFNTICSNREAFAAVSRGGREAVVWGRNYDIEIF